MSVSIYSWTLSYHVRKLCRDPQWLLGKKENWLSPDSLIFPQWIKQVSEAIFHPPNCQSSCQLNTTKSFQLHATWNRRITGSSLSQIPVPQNCEIQENDCCLPLPSFVIVCCSTLDNQNSPPGDSNVQAGHSEIVPPGSLQMLFFPQPLFTCYTTFASFST